MKKTSSKRNRKVSHIRKKLKKTTIPVIPNRTPRKRKRLEKLLVTPERETFTNYSTVLVKDKEMENFIMRKPTRPLLYKPKSCRGSLSVEKFMNVTATD